MTFVKEIESLQLDRPGCELSPVTWSHGFASLNPSFLKQW